MSDDLNQNLLKKSPSLNELNKKSEVEIEFEGDGKLGIIFSNIDDNIVVTRILPNTVADEYYELKINM